MDTGLILWGTVGLSGVMSIAWKVVLLIIGLNALIIVHEFGHFIVARWCGVRCDKFYIWFDIYGLKFFKFKWGDTEFGLGVLPLGGYVKMLGQEDNPGQIAKEIERARAAKEVQSANSGSVPNESKESEVIEATPEPAPDSAQLEKLEEAMYAKDSYLAKSVPQRMAIIVAGVTMNIIFAFLCAVVAYTLGVTDIPPTVGNVTAGSPAWKAGLRTGDRILSVDGKKMYVFSDIMQSMVGKENEGAIVAIDRPKPDGEFEAIELKIFPQKRENDLAPTIGVVNISTLDISEKEPLEKKYKEIHSEEFRNKLAAAGTLKAIDGTPVADSASMQRELSKSFDKSVRLAFEKIDAEGGEKPRKTELDIPVAPMNELGIRFEIGAITAVQPGSDAEKKGIAPGDTILEIDGVASFDPLKLPQHMRKLANNGVKRISISIRKANGEKPDPMEVDLIPDAQTTAYSGFSHEDPMACESLGIAYEVTNIVADHGEIPRGAKATGMTLLAPYPKDLFQDMKYSGKNADGYHFSKVGEVIGTPFLCGMVLQVVPSDSTIRVHYDNGGVAGTCDLKLTASKDWFDPERGIVFKREQTTIIAKDFSEACSLGLHKTIDSALAVYKFLRNIGTSISARALGGPVTIVKVAYVVTENGFGAFLIFLCLIGANLAVLNILPIPVLDGGHMVFLAYEGITGKPANEKIQIVLSYIGLFLLLSLMVWAIMLDFSWIKRF